jgi:hypothetical protein
VSGLFREGGSLSPRGAGATAGHPLIQSAALRRRGPTLTSITFEVDSALLVRELDRDVKLPGTIASDVAAAAGVVVEEPGMSIGRQTDVEEARIGLAFFRT